MGQDGGAANALGVLDEACPRPGPVQKLVDGLSLPLMMRSCSNARVGQDLGVDVASRHMLTLQTLLAFLLCILVAGIHISDIFPEAIQDHGLNIRVQQGAW